MPRGAEDEGLSACIIRDQVSVRKVLASWHETDCHTTQTIRDEEKAIIFCQIPAVTVLLWTVYHLLGLRVAVITSFQSNEQRQGTIDEFNRHGYGLWILILRTHSLDSVTTSKKIAGGCMPLRLGIVCPSWPKPLGECSAKVIRLMSYTYFLT